MNGGSVAGSKRAPGRDRVVGRDDVAERLPLHDERLAAVGVQRAGGQGEQDADQADVEQQVAGLAEPAGLGGQRQRAGPLVVTVDDVPQPRPAAGSAPPQGGRHAGGHGLDRLVDGPGRVRGQPLEPARGGGRAAAPLGGVGAGPRHDAAEQADEQQQVDRGEPRRGVDVEEPEPVQPLPGLRVVGLVGADGAAVDRPLREQRAGDGGHREQEQQDQRRAHARQLPPQPAQRADRAERRAGRGRRPRPPGAGSSWSPRRAPAGPGPPAPLTAAPGSG